MNRLKVSIQSKQFRRASGPALSNVEFTGDEGEFIAVVGPSGAGKSTLLNIIGGLDSDYRGEVSCESSPGRPVRRVAYMFQDPRLMPWLSVLDNLLLVLEPGDASIALARETLDMVGLGDSAYAFPGELSGGMQRRVALARAFVIGPSLLLMDEPFVSLDQPTAENLQSRLLDLWQATRPTVVFVTHDLASAVSLADRVLFFASGPGRVILQQTIDMPRPRPPRGREVQLLCDELIKAHPDLLSGIVNGDNVNDNISYMDSARRHQESKKS